VSSLPLRGLVSCQSAWLANRALGSVKRGSASGSYTQHHSVRQGTHFFWDMSMYSHPRPSRRRKVNPPDMAPPDSNLIL
jgi:hypothetical protein